MAWQIWNQLPVEALIPEHPRTNKVFKEQLAKFKTNFDTSNSETVPKKFAASTSAAVAPMIE